jgi:hypothetical protein
MNLVLFNENYKYPIRIHTLEHGNVILPPRMETTLHFSGESDVLVKTQTVYPNNKLSPVSQFSVKKSQYVLLKTRDNVNNTKHLPLIMMIFSILVIGFLVAGLILLRKKKGWMIISWICLSLTVCLFVFWLLALLYQHKKFSSPVMKKIVQV